MYYSNIHIIETLNKIGYIKIPLFSAHEIAELLNRTESILSNTDILNDKYHVTLLSNDMIYKERIQDLLTPILEKKIKAFIPDYTIVTTNLIIKPPKSGEVPLHQNWTFVNEEKHRSYTIWIPLVATNELNGTLEFISGSHNLFCDVKRGHNTPYFFLDERNDLKKYLKSVPVEIGEALILDDAILHASKQNDTTENRVAIQATVAPANATLYHFHYKKSFFWNKLYKFKVTNEFYKDLKLNFKDVTSVTRYRKRKISNKDWARIKEIY